MNLLHLTAHGPATALVQHDNWPSEGFVWGSIDRSELLKNPQALVAMVKQRTGIDLLELHLHDLLNAHHPSHFDDTRDYDLVIFRQLVLADEADDTKQPLKPRLGAKGGPPILQRMSTQPVSFVVFDGLLLSVHGDDCSVDEEMRHRLQDKGNQRLPSSPADLMLRMVNHMVDRFLDLRKPLTEQLDHWQAELLDPSTRFVNWRALLSARNNLHALEDLCDGQRSAVQQWLLTLEQQPLADDTPARNERDMLRARSRDVLEHIDRVVHHVQRLEQNAETAVQMHFSAQSHRTNEIMKTLTALTAIFLPLNLITGFFGMNFEFLPLIHNNHGLWWAVGAMVLVAAGLGMVFWRKRYLARNAR